jgi:maleate isomerase
VTTAHPYTIEDDTLPRFGLIVLQVDETIESDFRRLFAPDSVRVHVSRVPSGRTLTPDSIATMETTLPGAASLLPGSGPLDVVGYACTSGTCLIGADRVRDLVRGATRANAVTDPLSAALAACRALGLVRVGIVSPYIPSVADPIRHAFEAAGITVPDTLSFGEETEAKVARIAPASIADAARTLARRSTLDGVFLSCTNLRTLDILGPLERELGLPVLSSNQVLAWHMAACAGLGRPGAGPVAPGQG